MDTVKNIILSPCKHAHCCLACFRRSTLRTCPVCRTVVSSITVLQTGVRLPVNPPITRRSVTRRVEALERLASAPVAVRDTAGTAVATDRTLSYRDTRAIRHSSSIVTSLASQSVLSSQRDEDVQSTPSYSNPPASITFPIAQQAHSSVRSLPPLHNNALRQIRTGSLLRDSTLPVNTRTMSAVPERALTDARLAADVPTFQPASKTVVLIGHSRAIIVSLARQLVAAFPPPRNADDAPAARLKSTIFIDGDAIQLVLIDCPPLSTRQELDTRVNRHSPNLVLLCADYFDVTSFESVIRLDMEVLDYLRFPCLWVLVRSSSIKRHKSSNNVDDSDIRVAKHFLCSHRQSIVVSVDGTKRQGNLRKLSSYIHRYTRRRHESRNLSVDNISDSELPQSSSTSLTTLWTNFTRPRDSDRPRRGVGLGRCLSGNFVI